MQGSFKMEFTQSISHISQLEKKYLGRNSVGEKGMAYLSKAKWENTQRISICDFLMI